MISSVEITNFRALPHLKVAELGRINLISGRNGVGKTSLLEALWFYHGRHNPGLLFNRNLVRVERLGPTENPIEHFATDLDSEVKVAAKESGKSKSDRTSNWVTVNSVPASSVTLRSSQRFSGDFPEQPYLSQSRGQSIDAEIDQVNRPSVEIMMKYQDGDLPIVEMPGRIVQTGEFIERRFDNQPSVAGLPIGLILTPTQPRNERQNTDRFSKAVREGYEEQLLKALQVVEPRLRHLSLLTDANVARIWCDLGGDRLVLIDNAGEGLSRALGYFIGMVATRSGLLLIDEIENGIHHTALPGLWSHISQLASDLDVQVVATTHSRECIVAAYETLGHSEQSFVLHRLYRTKQHEARIQHYSGDTLEAALELDLEIR